MANVPREASLEFYLGGWTAIVARQTRPITMSRGRADWAGTISPTRFAANLGNASGDLDPDNPLGIWYGLLGQNTQMRFSYVLLRDTFGRTVVDGLGTTTPDGVAGHATATLPYTLSGTAANFDVGSGVATMVIASASDQRRAYLPGAVHRRIDVTLDIPTMTAPASGNNVQSILLRGTSLTDYVAVDVDVTAAGVVRIAIRDNDDTTYLFARTTVAGVVRTSPMRLRAQVEGQTIRGKLWNPSGDNEPFAFQAEAVSTNMSYTGWVGMRAATGVGNTNVTFTMDNLVIRSVRFFGVAGEITPKADTSGNDQYVSIEGAGVLRRLERNKSELRSALYRYLSTQVSPKAYWSLEDGATSTAAAPAIAGGSPLNAFGSATIPPFSDEDGPAGSAQLPDFSSKSSLAAHLSGQVATGELQMELWFKTATGTSTGFTAVVPLQWDLSGTLPAADVLLFIAEGAGGNGVGTIAFDIAAYEATPPSESNRSVSVFVSALSVPNVQGSWRQLRVCMNQTGVSTVELTAYLDGVLLGTASGSPWTFGAATAVVVNPTQDTPGANAYAGVDGVGIASIGHVAVYNSIADPGSYLAGTGYLGETAGRRIERLCEEEGIPFNYIGELDTTAAMGPQGVDSVLNLLQECVEADLGTLVESRMAHGLLYRTGASLYNQTAAVTLDFSSGQLAESLDLIRDDKNIQNYVTASRALGGEYIAAQTSGPLNVNDPDADPEGVGVYSARVSANVAYEAQLPDIASWVRHLGTATGPRVSDLTTNAASRNITAALDEKLLSLDVDDLITVENLTSRRRYDALNLIARGYTETLDTIFVNTLSFTCAPADPYRVVQLDSTSGRLASDATTLNEDLTTTETGVDIAISDGTVWTTTDTPIDVKTGGERMTASAVTGASSPQTLTVTRSVNGVVKTHSTGAPLALADPAYLA